jgi:hypothetical protein
MPDVRRQRDDLGLLVGGGSPEEIAALTKNEANCRSRLIQFGRVWKLN